MTVEDEMERERRLLAEALDRHDAKNGNGHRRHDKAKAEPPIATSWRPVDLTEAVAGIDLPPPCMLRRIDGKHLIYAGHTHSFSGESESCKSWAAQALAAERLALGEHVGYVDFEDDERGVCARLLSMGVKRDVILERFHYIRPEEPLHTRDGKATAGGVDFGLTLEGLTCPLWIVDGVTEAMTTEGLDLLDNSDIAKWSRRLPKRLARTGAAVVVLDHVVKNAEQRGRYSIGGQHKLAGITGAAFIFSVLRPLSRAAGAEPVEGNIKITVAKDRPGHVRGVAKEGHVATMEIVAYPDGGVMVRFVPAGDESIKPAGPLVARIAEHLDTYDGATKNGITDEVTGNTDAIREALKWMADLGQGFIRIEKVGQSHRHYLTDKGRKELL